MAHTLRWRLLGAAIPAVALCIPLGAAAQELEEIIVTARKRDESLLEAPLSITVFSAETSAGRAWRLWKIFPCKPQAYLSRTTSPTIDRDGRTR